MGKKKSAERQNEGLFMKNIGEAAPSGSGKTALET